MRNFLKLIRGVEATRIAIWTIMGTASVLMLYMSSQSIVVDHQGWDWVKVPTWKRIICFIVGIGAPVMVWKDARLAQIEMRERDQGGSP